MSRLEVVAEREQPDAAQLIQAQEAAKKAVAEALRQQQVATQMLMTALKALGERFVIAAASLFTIITTASAFYLWMLALPNLDTRQIVGLSIYSVFILAINVFGRRK